MRLIVTRHGETDFNLAGRFCGVSDVPLNATGLSQACELAARLRGMHIDEAVSSPMLRARQTSDIVCAELGLRYRINEQFTERNLGVLEGLTRDEINERYPGCIERYYSGYADDGLDGGESLRHFCGRIDGALAKLNSEYKDKTVLLICHGVAARAINRYCKKLSFTEMMGFTLKNCDIVIYDI